MPQAHSFVWYYFWIAPNLLLLGLALLLCRRDCDRRFSSFLRFAFFSSTADLLRIAADISPLVSGDNYWLYSWAEILIESLLKYAAIAEVFSHLLDPFPSLSRLGRNLVKWVGVALVLVAACIAAVSHDGSKIPIVSGFHIIAQTVFIVELGLVLAVLLFASRFELSWDRFSYGVLMGFGFSSCDFLIVWALLTNGNLSPAARTFVDFCGMANFHVCVLIWYYYLLVPARLMKQPPPPPPPDHHLDLWNRELERLLHR